VVRFPAVGRRIMQSMTVPYSFISHLFEAFRATKRDGMGLGLTICRSIAKAHGGELRYEPNPGGGTIFRFTPRGSDQWPLKESSTPVDYCICSLQRVRRPKSASAQSPIPIHSRQTVRSAAMITGPRKRPTNPNDVSPPRIPISASRKGSRVVPPMSAG
jgi:hypothetical protein